MLRFKKMVIVTPLVLAATLLVSSPVLARQGADDITEIEVHNSSTSSQSGDSTSSSNATKVEVHSSNNHATQLQVEDSKTTARTEGNKLLTELRQEHKSTKSAEKLKQVCEQRKSGISQRVASISSNVDAYKLKVDNIFAMAEAYQQTNNITVENYDVLQTAAAVAKTNAAESITALQALVPTIDCTKTDNVDNLAAFKAAAQDARDKLKTYKAAVKDLLKALRTASPAKADGSTN